MVELLHSEILRHAFAGATVVAVVAGVVGYFLVLRAYAFAGEALTDVGFAGASGAVLFGFVPVAGMLFFSLLAALGLGFLGKKVRGRNVEIGMVLSVALALGVLFLSLYSHSSAKHTLSAMSVLFGSILTISSSDIVTAIIGGAVALSAIAVMYRPLVFASIDPSGAEARGVPVHTITTAYLVTLALTTGVSMLVVGVLLVKALLIAPAAAAVNVTTRPVQALILSVMLSLAIVWAGLVLTFAGTVHHFPAGFYISSLAAVTYFGSLLLRRRRGPRRHIHAPHLDRETGYGA